MADLLQELVGAYGPVGQEDAVREICLREAAAVADEVWVDGAGNVVALLKSERRDAPVVRVMAHMDELSMIVKRVEPDGTLRLSPLGTMYPGNFGLGPVAVLGRQKELTAVLTLGSEHTTKESQRIWETKPDQGDKALDWLHVYAFTGRSTDELADAGVTAGTRVCVHRSKRELVRFGGYVGSYFLDDRAAIVVLLETARRLRAHGSLPVDVYLVFTTGEEVGANGGMYAARALPDGVTIAVEVGPTEQEYGTSVHGGPIIAYSDALTVYDKPTADRLMDVAARSGLSPQPAVLGAFESDASHSKASGVCPRAALLCLPTLSTHGYEVMAADAVVDAATVLEGFLASEDVRQLDD
ncbi:M42 family metallopeptidase [Mycolicibacterium bacteremicum]|uniref:Peptidase M42 n=1 Tax=Mycolicibacterium bacteremicum TaxID=564198 RepID=A0A1W9Z1B0_MYCBA|nr:M20/M25/M40 family metallo-hydrolase [Mycolicibacterium bacteremicum]MCV7432317.1 M20/M25/M40 family metallo-hydrolase [Mycolicibacterium bacteremicum]ORA06084.1 peptidase M42 [Mycolicibacterium bacteremicum]